AFSGVTICHDLIVFSIVISGDTYGSYQVTGELDGAYFVPMRTDIAPSCIWAIGIPRAQLSITFYENADGSGASVTLGFFVRIHAVSPTNVVDVFVDAML